MQAKLAELAHDLDERRARRELAQEAVGELRVLSAEDILEKVAGWLQAAYGWEPDSQVRWPPNGVILQAGGRPILVMSVPGTAVPSWRDTAEVAKVGDGAGVDIKVLISPSGSIRESCADDVWVWGPPELQEIFFAIRFEGEGIAL